jgi:hypothetical protein
MPTNALATMRDFISNFMLCSNFDSVFREYHLIQTLMDCAGFHVLALALPAFTRL